MDDFVTNLTLDIDCNKEMPMLNSAQFDKGRKIQLTVTSNGNAFSLTNCTVVLKGIRADKSPLLVDCSVESNGKATLITDDTTFSVSGLTICKFVISDADKTYSTQQFIVSVDSALEGDIEDEERYSLYDRLIREIQTTKRSLYKYVEVTGTSSSAVNNCTDPDTVYKVYVASGVVTTGMMNVICTPTIGVYKAQYAWSKDGYIIVRTYDGTTWRAWDFVPHSSRVATMISTAIANLVSNSRTIAGIDLQDDITAAELKAALDVPNPTNYYTKDEIDSTFVDLNTFNSELDDIDSEITAKADKSDTYTKAEVNAAIQTAIGGVENGSY